MDNVEKILHSLTVSIDQSLKDFSECRDLAQKKSHAEIIKLLCESMGVLFDDIYNSAPYPFDDGYDDFEDYEEDKEYDDEVERHRKAKNNKKGHKGEIPF